jgi:TetR/AcrR family transcriptional regulator, mexJK operon transcriptional repressor
MASSTTHAEIASRGTPVPRGEKRRGEIVEVAARVFLAHGFADTTMQAIAAEAGASKETLYRHFGSKEGLFAEVIEIRSEHFIERLDENLQRPGVLAEILRDVALRLMEKMTAPYGVSLFRIVVAEGARNPDLGRIFFERGPELVCKRLAQFLTAAMERNELRRADMTIAAKIFLGAVLSYYHTSQLVLHKEQLLTPEQVVAHVDEVVAMFLLRYAL